MKYWCLALTISTWFSFCISSESICPRIVITEDTYSSTRAPILINSTQRVYSSQDEYSTCRTCYLRDEFTFAVLEFPYETVDFLPLYYARTETENHSTPHLKDQNNQNDSYLIEMELE